MAENNKTYLVVSRGEEDKGTLIENASDFEIVGGVLYVTSADGIGSIAAFSEWVSIQEVQDELD